MKLGFLTAALPDNTLEQAAKWGAESGFQAIEIACWPLQKATRRYAGVTHIDVTDLDKTKAKEICNMLDGYGLQISSLAYYPNPLHPDAEHRETVIAHLKKVIEVGMEPETLARYVLDGVEQDQLYILPYPEFRGTLEDIHMRVMTALARPEDDPDYEKRVAHGVPGGERRRVDA